MCTSSVQPLYAFAALPLYQFLIKFRLFDLGCLLWSVTSNRCAQGCHRLRHPADDLLYMEVRSKGWFYSVITSSLNPD